jgi:hypothetical protein
MPLLSENATPHDEEDVMALGEQIGTESGTVTAFRVQKDGFGVKVESQFQGHGEMLGIPFVDYSTYWSVYRPDGNFTGGANGVIFTQEAEAASYEGTGGGHMLGRAGAASWRGALYFFSASPHFAQLNSIAVLFEFEIADNARDMEIKYYEWK